MSQSPPSNRLPIAAVFLVLLAITLGYQALYSYSLMGGDWIGLFYSGDQMPRPPELPGFQFHGTLGYDGQQYRVLAHDPLNRKGYWKYLDDARFRSRRILIPALAGLLGGGSRWAVDFWFVAIIDVSLALGGLCFIRLAGDAVPRLIAILLYSVVPAAIASTDRMVLDGALVTAFLAALLFLREGRRTALWALLACAPLIREAGILLNAGAALVFLRRRDFGGALRACTATIPALAWWWWSGQHTSPSSAGALLSIPLIPQIARMFYMVSNPVPPWINVTYQAIVVATILCLLTAFMMLAIKLRRNIEDDVLLVLPSAILLAFASSTDIIREPYGFARIDSLLLTWAGLRLLMDGRRVAAYAYFTICGSGLLLFRALPIWTFVKLLL